MLKRAIVMTGLGLAVASIANGAAIITARLDVTPVTNGSDGLWNVTVFAKADGTPSNGDGGISGFQFDILSTDIPGLKVFPSSQGGGPLAGKVKTTYNITGFTTQLPAKTDATPALNPTAVPPYVGPDGDLDGVGGSFFDTGSFTNT